MYNILETHLIFENNALKAVAVLWENKGDIRASMSTTKPMSGYHYLKSYDIPTMTLFNSVAAFGRKLTDAENLHFFPQHDF